MEVIARLNTLTNRQPELGPYAEAVAVWQGHKRWPSPAELNHFLGLHVNPPCTGGAGCNMSFVAQAPGARFKSRGQQGVLPMGLPVAFAGGKAAQYVQAIALGSSIPTRLSNLHDFANALTWSVFPKTKRTVFSFLFEDYRQYYELENADAAQLSRAGGRGRGVKADRLTVLDESGVLAWQKEGGLSSVVFGHGLIEQLVLGGPPVYAPTWTLPPEKSNAQTLTKDSFRDELSLDEHAALYFTKFFQSANPRPDDKTTAVHAQIAFL